MEKVLEAILTELLEIKHELRGAKIDTCSAKEALELLGLKNTAYLKYYHTRGLLDRRETGSNSFTYYKSECKALAERLKNKLEQVPTVREAIHHSR